MEIIINVEGPEQSNPQNFTSNANPYPVPSPQGMDPSWNPPFFIPPNMPPPVFFQYLSAMNQQQFFYPPPQPMNGFYPPPNPIQGPPTNPPMSENQNNPKIQRFRSSNVDVQSMKLNPHFTNQPSSHMYL